MDRFQASNIANMQGLVTLITGGGTGIGLMIAKGYAANGAKVYITGRHLDVLERTVAEVKSLGMTLIPLKMDVDDKTSIGNAVKVIGAADGKLDVLVNNAGIAGSGPVVDGPDLSKSSGKTYGDLHFNEENFDNWKAVLSTNTIAPFFVTMGFLGLLEKGAQSRPGETSSVITISSGAGRSKLSNNVYAYSASKAGVDHVSNMMATEFARRQIPVRVNIILPGIFPSRLNSTEPEVVQKIAENPLPGAIAAPPVKRPGRDEEIAFAALYLASSGGGYSNGAVISVDGGWSIVNL